MAQVPEELRRQDPALIHLPLIQFLSESFLIQLGPRVVSLVTKPNSYPGWVAIERELGWLLVRLKAAGFVGETERLSARYIDFFQGDVFSKLRLGLQVDGQPLQGLQTDLTTVLRRGALTIRLNVTNGAVVATKDGPKQGSVLDVDAWFGPIEVDLFGNGLARFGEAHQAIKGLFFGLIELDLLATLNPSVFLTDRGGIELCWEDREGKSIQVEFTATGAEFFHSASEEEGVVPFDGLAQLASRLSG
ncbi:MAG: TIGR04255 family protein [Verrucomicrobia bacterium]|nr:TIGR04255 family protein [Verrucomicrobiota bacterium]